LDFDPEDRWLVAGGEVSVANENHRMNTFNKFARRAHAREVRKKRKSHPRFRAF
jgi:hypothetical protein